MRGAQFRSTGRHTNPTRQRGFGGIPLAGASESTSRTSALVTPSTRPVISVTTLLELARWCQQRLDFTEGRQPCADAQLDTRLPPVHGSGHLRPAADTPLAGAATRGPTTPVVPADPDDSAPPPRPRPRRSQGGGR